MAFSFGERLAIKHIICYNKQSAKYPLELKWENDGRMGL